MEGRTRHTLNALRKALEEEGIDASSLSPFPGSSDDLYLLRARPEEAMDQWERLRRLVTQTGRWPVIGGDDGDLEVHRENLELSGRSSPVALGDVRCLLRHAEAIDPARWVREKNGGAPLPASQRRPPDEQEDRATLEGILLKRGLTAGSESRFVALTPTDRCWETPAHLRFGGFNACPAPPVQVALWRRWGDLYGAEIVAICRDMVLARVSRPPADPEAAFELAAEQHAYCPDLVSGLGTIDALAGWLLGRDWWYFWWD